MCINRGVILGRACVQMLSGAEGPSPWAVEKWVVLADFGVEALAFSVALTNL